MATVQAPLLGGSWRRRLPRTQLYAGTLNGAVRLQRDKQAASRAGDHQLLLLKTTETARSVLGHDRATAMRVHAIVFLDVDGPGIYVTRTRAPRAFAWG